MDSKRYDSLRDECKYCSGAYKGCKNTGKNQKCVEEWLPSNPESEDGLNAAMRFDNGGDGAYYPAYSADYSFCD